MPRQTSFQATQAMQNQLADLRDAGFGTTTDVLRLAVDRMYREEIDMKRNAQYQIGTTIEVPHPHENTTVQAEIIGYWTDKINRDAGITVVDVERTLTPWQISFGYL